jgi:hypothetical protein
VKRSTFLPFAVAVATWSASASAQTTQTFSKGTFALGAERLSGFFHAHGSTGSAVGPGGAVFVPAADASVNRIAILGENASGPYDLPKVGFDYFFADHWGVGGSILIEHTDLSGSAASINASGSGTEFGFAPRVGYGYMFTDSIGIWPRGGLSYFLETVDANNGASTTVHFFSFNLECPFLFKITPGFGVTVGPTFDVSFEGGDSLEGRAGNVSTNVSASYWAFGIAGGLVGFF